MPQKDFYTDAEMNLLEQHGVAQTPDFIPDAPSAPSHQGALDFIGRTDIQKEAEKGLGKRIFQGLPQAALQVGVGTPAQFVASAVEAPKSIFTGKASNKTYNLPGLDPFKSIQSEAQQHVQEGGSVGGAIALKGIKTLLGGADTLGLTKGIKAGSTLLKTANEARLGKKSLADVWEVIKPSLNTREQTEAIKAGDLVVQKGTTKLIPRGRSETMLKLAKDAGVSTKNNPIDNVNKIYDAISLSAQKIRKSGNSSKAIWNENEIKGVMNRYVLDPIAKGKPGFITVKSDAALKSTADNLVNAVQELAHLENRHSNGILNIRQGFDEIVEQEFGTKVFSRTDPKGNIVRAVRHGLNNLLELKVPGSKAELKNQSMLYDAADNIASKAPKEGYGIGTTRLQRFGQKHPTIVKGAKFLGKSAGVAAGGGSGYYGVRKLFNGD